MSIVLEVKNLYKVFGPDPHQGIKLLDKGKSKDEILKTTGNTIALQDVSISVDEGETFVVMGLSGSGKSTLVRCLNRLIEPTRGEILLDGEDVLMLEKQKLEELRRFRMSMVFQRFGLLPHRTVVENVAYGLEVRGVPEEERLQKANEWLDTVGLSGYENSLPKQLSGGMQQRVGLARALCTDPEILLMDEAFSALDPLIRREMQNELMQLQAELHKTIVFITHDLDEALRLGDRIAILKDGLVVQVGTPEEILMNPADSYVQDFTQDVNRSRVLTAGVAMVEPLEVVQPRTGPRVALELMREHALGSVFVVDEKKRYVGLLTAEQAIKARDQKVKNLTELELEQTPTTHPETTLNELLNVFATTKWPVAVLNEKGVLLGIIPRVAAMSALAGENGDLMEDEQKEEANSVPSTEMKQVS